VTEGIAGAGRDHRQARPGAVEQLGNESSPVAETLRTQYESVPRSFFEGRHETK